MDNIHKGIITFDSGRGWYFCEDFADRIAVFIHLKYSADSRYLRIGDIISFQRIVSLKDPTKFEAREIRYAGHNVARQIGETRRTGGRP